MEFKSYKGDLIKVFRELQIRDLYRHWWNYWWGKIMFASWGPLNKVKRIICRHDYWPLSMGYDNSYCVYRCSKCGKYKVEEYR